MEKIVAKVMKKLADAKIDVFVKRIEDVYRKHKNTKFEDQSFPKDLLQVVGDLMDSFHPEQKDKLEILKEIKKKHLFNFNLNKNLERAWRLILKKWDLSHYRLDGGI